jgi:hypothetical protein
LSFGVDQPLTNIHDAHAEAPSFFTLGLCQPFPFAAKVNDQGDAKFFQFPQACVIRLRTTIQKIVDLAHIGDSVKTQCLREGWMRGMRAGMLCKSFCRGERERKQRNERESESQPPSNRLAQKSLRHDRGENVDHGRRFRTPRRETTPQDMGAFRKS